MDQITTRNVTLSGLRDIMLDRYAGDNDTELSPKDKLYLAKDGESLVLPVGNLLSFLSAENTKSCVNMFGSKGWRDVAAAIKSCVVIEPDPVPILYANGKPRKFTGFEDDGVYLHHAVAKIKKSASVAVPNPKTRPVIRMPWQLKFELQFMQNEYIQETTLKQYFEKGGVFVGLGTYRPVFGKFEITEWK